MEAFSDTPKEATPDLVKLYPYGCF
jgi:hypothetical protein